MKILTLNINSIRAHIESFIDILRRANTTPLWSKN